MMTEDEVFEGGCEETGKQAGDGEKTPESGAASRVAAEGQQLQRHGAPAPPAAEDASEESGADDESRECVADRSAGDAFKQEQDEAFEIEIGRGNQGEGQDAESACEENEAARRLFTAERRKGVEEQTGAERKAKKGKRSEQGLAAKKQ